MSKNKSKKSKKDQQKNNNNIKQVQKWLSQADQVLPPGSISIAPPDTPAEYKDVNDFLSPDTIQLV